MDVSFRSVNYADEEELNLIALEDSKIPKLYDHEFSWSESSVVDRKHLYRKQILPSDFFEVAIIDQKIAGFHIVKKIPYGISSAGLIITLWVDEKYRGRGIAKSLKERAEIWARKMGLDHFQTSVHASNKTMLEINQKSGFYITQYTLKKSL